MNNNSSKNQPPKLPLRFLKWYCHPDYLEDIEGDLTERFESRIKLKGIKQANWAFTKEVLQLFRPEIISPIGGTHKLNHYGMLKNYFSIAPRILLKNKLITFISLISLIIGAVSFQLIYSWVNNEVNINSFHKNFDNIYLILGGVAKEKKFETLSKFQDKIIYLGCKSGTLELKNTKHVHLPRLEV